MFQAIKNDSMRKVASDSRIQSERRLQPDFSLPPNCTHATYPLPPWAVASHFSFHPC